LKKDLVEPFKDPPMGPNIEDLHLTSEELQLDLTEGHSELLFKCEDDNSPIHPCGSNRVAPNAWANFFKACNYINVNGNVIVNYHGSEVDDGEVDIDPDHLEWFKSMFFYLQKPGKYYEYETRILYTKEEFINRCIDKETVVQYYDKTKKKTVTRKHESAQLWINDRSQVQSYYDLTHVPGGSRVIPHPKGSKYENLLNVAEDSEEETVNAL
jgi:hypothetical protein